VYSKELFVNKGVDNIIEFAFVNQDQKTVNIDGKAVTFRLIDRESENVILQKQLTHVLPVTGLSSIVINSDELNNINTQQCYYTLELEDSSNRYAVYVDSAGRNRGVIVIGDGVQPAHRASLPVEVPSRPLVASTSNVTYYSSSFTSQKKRSFTVQCKYENFTGQTYLEGSTISDFSIPYDITTPTVYSLTNGYSGSEVLQVEGYHPYVRLVIVNEGTVDSDLNRIGEVTKILYR
jgi:hypothetical protein